MLACCECTNQALFRAREAGKGKEKEGSSESERCRGDSRDGRFEDLVEPFDALARALGVVERQHRTRVRVVESMHEMLFVSDSERIVNAPRLRQGFMNGDGVPELAQQTRYARAVADDVRRIVNYYLQAIRAACEEKGAQQIVTPGRVVGAAEDTFEQAQPARRPADQQVESDLVTRPTFEARVRGMGLIVHLCLLCLCGLPVANST